jgi:glycosyltransferase involved in cell wall biosynthesis
MRIGIDARPATEVRAGIGTYLRELLTALARSDHGHRFFLYARDSWAGVPADDRFEWRLFGGSDVPWNLRAALHASRECDVYLSTISYLSPWFLRTPSVLVVHDMIAFDATRLPARRSALIERATIRPALRRCSAIITISHSTQRDLITFAPHVESKTCVVLDAAQERFNTDAEEDDRVLSEYGLERPYVLAVGTLEPRKNLPRLIEAFATLPAALRAKYDLVLVGATGWGTDETFAAIAHHTTLVRTLGYVNEHELPALYRQATLLAFPSIYEGFGLPVLEAMQCGTPVLAGRTSSIPEVGGDAVRYVDPLSVSDLRQGLTELLVSPAERGRLSRLGLEQAKRFSWARTTEETLAVLETLAT